MQQPTDFLQVQHYLRDLVSQSNFLKSFTGIFSREYFNLQGSYEGLPSPGLAMFRYELGHESSGQNTLAVRRIGFSIFFNNVAPDDFAAQYEAIAEAERLANKVLARIRLDSSRQQHPMFNAYLPQTPQILPFELKASSFGVDVFLSLRNPQNLSVDPADWQDIEQICP